MDESLLNPEIFWNEEEPVAMVAEGVERPCLDGAPPLVYFRTSGSIALPRWVGLSRNALLYSATMVNAHLQVTADSVWGLALPLHHVGGLGVVARAHDVGSGLEVYNKPWQAHDFSDWLERMEVTHTSLVPTQVHDLVVAGIKAPKSLKVVVVGGGELSNEIGRAARALRWPILASYGMTEAGSQIATQGLECLDQPFANKPIEKLPHWRLKVVGDGCLAIAGPALFEGWLVKEKNVWRFDRREGEWHVTRDRAQLSDMVITPMGRSDLRVKVLGELVDLTAIEERLISLSSHQLKHNLVVVVAINDARAEHLLVPVFDAAVEKSIIDKILEAYHEQAAGPERLQDPVILYPMPCNDLGKPQRAQISTMLGEL